MSLRNKQEAKRRGNVYIDKPLELRWYSRLYFSNKMVGVGYFSEFEAPRELSQAEVKIKNVKIFPFAGPTQTPMSRQVQVIDWRASPHIGHYRHSQRAVMHNV